MGCDPRAILFYGIAYDSEELSDDQVEEFDDAERARQNEAVPQPANKKYTGKDWDEWRAKVAEWEAGQVRMGIYGYENELNRYLYIPTSKIESEWSDVSEVASLDVGLGWGERIEESCRRNGLPFKKPGWKLVSLYF